MKLIIMVSMDLFTEGQKLTLFFQKDSNMVEMTCSIETVLDDRLNLQLPQYFMRYVEFLQVGRKMTAKIFTKLGTVDFNTVVIYSPLEDNFTIEMDRNSMRLTTGDQIPVVRAVENLDINFKEQSYKVRTFELSTEYLKFYSDSKLNQGEEFMGAIALPKDYGIINFRGVISGKDPIYDNEYTATYITMTEKDKQTLLYYMYMYSKDID